MLEAEQGVIEILYKNSTNCGQGMVIDFSDIHKVIKLLTEDKVKFTQLHVETALKAASSNFAEWNKNVIINAYSAENIK